MATDDELDDARVLASIGRIIGTGNLLPLVDAVTKLPPAPTTDAIRDGLAELDEDGRIADAAVPERLDEANLSGTTDATIAASATKKAAAGLFGDDYVQVGQTLDTSELQAFIADVAAGRARGGLSPRIYTADNLVLPENVLLDGWAGEGSRFPAGGTYRYGPVMIKRPSGSTNPIVTLAGNGSGLRNITIIGNGSVAGTGIVAQGLETRLDTVRVIGIAGIGLDVQRANNTSAKWQSIYIDDCGDAASSSPAMKIWSKTLGGSFSNETNTLDIFGLTIERSRWVSLDVAYGATGEYWAEWVRIFGYHNESSYLDTPNTGYPQNRIGNVRGFTLVDPFIYGGSGPLIKHQQQVDRTYGNGAIRLIGGTLNGSDQSAGAISAGSLPTPHLVELTTGDNFAAIGTNFMRYANRAILAQSTYGPNVSVDQSNRFYGPGAVDFLDQRATTLGARTIIPLRGDAHVVGHIATARTVAPAISGSSGISSPALIPATSDGAGAITFGTTASPPAAGPLLTMDFYRPYTREPAVVATPGSSAAVALGLFAVASTTQLKIYSTAAPTASQGSTVYKVDFTVIGLESTPIV